MMISLALSFNHHGTKIILPHWVFHLEFQSCSRKGKPHSHLSIFLLVSLCLTMQNPILSYCPFHMYTQLPYTQKKHDFFFLCVFRLFWSHRLQKGTLVNSDTCIFEPEELISSYRAATSACLSQKTNSWSWMKKRLENAWKENCFKNHQECALLTLCSGGIVGWGYTIQAQFDLAKLWQKKLYYIAISRSKRGCTDYILIGQLLALASFSLCHMRNH